MSTLRIRREVGKNRFTNTEVDEWSKHSGQVVEGNTPESFQWRLQVFMDRTNIT